MKKILILMTLLASMTSYAGFNLKLGAVYDNFSTPSVIEKTTNTKTGSKPARAISGVLQLDYTFNLYKKFGLAISTGSETQVGYGMYDHIGIAVASLGTETKQKFIPIYSGVYVAPGLGFAINDNLSLRIQGKIGAGVFSTYFFKTPLKVGQIDSRTTLGFAVPFGGVIGLDYNNFNFNIEVGAKYLFAKLPSDVQKFIDQTLSQASKFFESNPLTYDLIVNGTKVEKVNKFTLNAGITIGYSF